MSERCTACGAPLVWADGRLVCPARSCQRHGQDETTVAMMELEAGP